MSSDPPPTLPTGFIPGTIESPRCVHNAHPDTCPFCKADDELAKNPELSVTKQREHEFGCPLFVNEKWTDVEHRNYERIYGEGSGRTECTCKP